MGHFLPSIFLLGSWAGYYLLRLKRQLRVLVLEWWLVAERFEGVTDRKQEYVPRNLPTYSFRSVSDSWRHLTLGGRINLL
jgi:hypothetical protein